MQTPTNANDETIGTMTNAYRLRRGGPSLRARLPVEVKIWQGAEVYVLHYGHRLGFRAIGRQLGISTTTAWRRFWFYQDYVMYPRLRPDLPRYHVPPQRGTRECPSRRAADPGSSSPGTPWDHVVPRPPPGRAAVRKPPHPGRDCVQDARRGSTPGTAKKLRSSSKRRAIRRRSPTTPQSTTGARLTHAAGCGGAGVLVVERVLWGGPGGIPSNPLSIHCIGSRFHGVVGVSMRHYCRARRQK
jgi:hypothetical protein